MLGSQKAGKKLLFAFCSVQIYYTVATKCRLKMSIQKVQREASMAAEIGFYGKIMHVLCQVCRYISKIPTSNTKGNVMWHARHNQRTHHDQQYKLSLLKNVTKGLKRSPKSSTVSPSSPFPYHAIYWSFHSSLCSKTAPNSPSQNRQIMPQDIRKNAGKFFKVKYIT